MNSGRVNVQRIALWVALLFLGATVLMPTGVGSLGAHPNATYEYAAASLRVEEFRRADTAAARGGESILLLRGTRTPRAIVLFHGLTNSPRQFRDLAAMLYASGDNVYVPRLPQHALKRANADDLSNLTAEQLRDVGDASVDVAAGLGDTVVVLGLSLRGNIAAWVAQLRPEVACAVVVAPALRLSHLSSVPAVLLMNLSLRIPDSAKHDPPDTIRVDRALGWTSHAIGQMLRLSKAVRLASEQHAPSAREIFVLVNAHDGTVSRAAIEDQVARWSEHGGRVIEFELPDSLQLPHDIVDRDEALGRTALTNPVLIALVHGASPSTSIAHQTNRAQQVGH